MIARADAFDVGDVERVRAARRAPGQPDTSRWECSRARRLLAGLKFDHGDGVVRAVGDIDRLAVGADRQGVGDAAEEQLFGRPRGNCLDDFVAVAVSMTETVSLLALATSTCRPSGVAAMPEGCRPTTICFSFPAGGQIDDRDRAVGGDVPHADRRAPASPCPTSPAVRPGLRDAGRPSC